MIKNQKITVYTKEKADGNTVYRLLFSCSAFVTGVQGSNFEKGITTADSYNVRIFIKDVPITKLQRIKKSDRIVLDKATISECKGIELTEKKALTVVEIQDNTKLSDRVNHFLLRCER